MFRTLLLAAALALVCVPAAAQPAPDIFVPPPDEAFGLGLVLAYDGGVVTVIQGEAAIRQACGINFGCLTFMEDATCQIRVWTGLPDHLERLALRNLIARCAGWVPTGE